MKGRVADAATGSGVGRRAWAKDDAHSRLLPVCPAMVGAAREQLNEDAGARAFGVRELEHVAGRAWSSYSHAGIHSAGRVTLPAMSPAPTHSFILEAFDSGGVICGH